MRSQCSCSQPEICPSGIKRRGPDGSQLRGWSCDRWDVPSVAAARLNEKTATEPGAGAALTGRAMHLTWNRRDLVRSETSQTRRFEMLPCRQRVAIDLARASRIASPVGTLLRGAKTSERVHKSDLDLCRYRCRCRAARVVACVDHVDWKNKKIEVPHLAIADRSSDQAVGIHLPRAELGLDLECW